ncbi:hypothetical protein RhiirA1_446445 [Rhizophagus irregularis]|uniref:Uncharacterized protein n=1 Tax=Rhizophagus irregularis TaxID=588596 RepID=A0A2N0R0B5_9GLOM|nr:hypothetical protein RhiirA1_446445 [Rhizophagus irregularis]
MGKSVKELNEEVASQSDKVDDDSGCSHDNYSEEEMLDESDLYNDDGYNGYDGYNEYGEHDRVMNFPQRQAKRSSEAGCELNPRVAEDLINSARIYRLFLRFDFGYLQNAHVPVVRMGQEWKLRLLIYRFTDLDPIKCKGDASGHILYNKTNFHLRSLVDLYGA